MPTCPARPIALSSLAALSAPLAIEPDTPSTWWSPGHEADYIAIVHSSLWAGHPAAAGPPCGRGVADRQGRRPGHLRRVELRPPRSGGHSQLLELCLSQLEWVRDTRQSTSCWWAMATTISPASAARPCPNLIPPYLIHIDPWLGETAGDNRYVSVDGPDDYMPDMAIGRIPARTAADVTAVVEQDHRL